MELEKKKKKKKRIRSWEKKALKKNGRLWEAVEGEGYGMEAAH